jgi:hypothetical protein
MVQPKLLTQDPAAVLLRAGLIIATLEDRFDNISPDPRSEHDAARDRTEKCPGPSDLAFTGDHTNAIEPNHAARMNSKTLPVFIRLSGR